MDRKTKVSVPEKRARGIILAVLLVSAAAAFYAFRLQPFFSGFGLFGSGQGRADVSAGSDLHARLEAAANGLELSRDPFSAAPIVSVSAQQAEGGVDVKGIFWDAGRPMAIINDSVVRVGDVVHNMVVVDIQKDRVILQEGSRYLEYRVTAGR